MKYVILLSLLLTSCMSTITDDELTRVDPKIKPYVDTFFKEAEKRGIYIPSKKTFNIGFGHLENDTQGRTYYASRTIVIDPTAVEWRNNPEQLVFHELGHLFLNRGHRSDRMGWRMRSIMYPQGSPPYTGSEIVRQYYINELFNKNEPMPEWASE